MDAMVQRELLDSPHADGLTELRAAVAHAFGIRELRPFQEEAIRASMAGATSCSSCRPAAARACASRPRRWCGPD